MDNYNLCSIRERRGRTYLETGFYHSPGLPVFASKVAIESELEKYLCESAEKILKSRKVELYWKDETDNFIILKKILSHNAKVHFLPECYRTQVHNSFNRIQPCCFFIGKGVVKNCRGMWELRLRHACEAMPHQKGYKLSIVLGAAVHDILVDGKFNILETVEHENMLLPNSIF